MFEDPSQVPKSEDAGVPYINSVAFAYNIHTSSCLL